MRSPREGRSSVEVLRVLTVRGRLEKKESVKEDDRREEILLVIGTTKY